MTPVLVVALCILQTGQVFWAPVDIILLEKKKPAHAFLLSSAPQEHLYRFQYTRFPPTQYLFTHRKS
jgi:hypothetical protein